MTPEERAAYTVMSANVGWQPPRLTEFIAAAIREAVDAETDAYAATLAAIVGQFWGGETGFGQFFRDEDCQECQRAGGHDPARPRTPRCPGEARLRRRPAMSTQVCPVCGGPRRFTTIPSLPGGLFDAGPSAVTHCRAEPAHDTGGAYLSAIRAKRAILTDAEWTADDRWKERHPG